MLLLEILILRSWSVSAARGGGGDRGSQAHREFFAIDRERTSAVSFSEITTCEFRGDQGMTSDVLPNRLTLAHEIRDTTADVDAGSTNEGTCIHILLTLFGGVSDLERIRASYGQLYLWKIAPLYPWGREFTLHPNELIP